MALIQGRPFLDFVVDYLLSHGFERIVFSTGYHGAWIADHVKARRDIDALISQEDQPLGTGGALRACRPLLSRNTTLVLNGDSLCRLDLGALLDAHEGRSAVVTIALVPANGRTDCGGVTLDEQGRIRTFLEKQAAPYVNAGIYAIQTRYVESIPAVCSLERDVFPQLVEHALYGFVSEAPLYDIGTPGRLAEFQALIHEHRQEEAAKGLPC
jgi:NDP-sugar pyrophosphorylase family protein